MINSERTTVDKTEIERFSRMAAQCWDPYGHFRSLHKLNPTRLAYIKEKICHVFKRDPLSCKPLKGLRILDVGCGGGLLCEPLVYLGAKVLGVDASSRNIAIAKIHANESGLRIDYRATTAEILAEKGETFDIILNMEVIEHVTNVSLFMEAVSSMIKSDGLMFISTINRTWKAWWLAIVGAEYLLHWLPIGTHTYKKFLHPGELKKELAASGLSVIDELGMTYNPFNNRWHYSSNMSVNYMLLARRHLRCPSPDQSEEKR
ncbi:MAG: 2-polyprenyl-6-hydroxyphenyl methylase / 3-demethylubiquinone-9 3-methyltransferase [Candidatus Tokpelaia sp. JSC085]|nr:MAG: 2-polyprenyl-6-hydroxyphenyl methylase / 3-demethylubiquinone-9 3-methyltransferase [Candidatus Tokpelaia sp. JSC085]